MLKLTTASFLAVLILSYSCGKSADAPSTFTEGFDIYMAGADSAGMHGYWKNGKAVTLPNCAYANCIQVVGSDVYVGGGIMQNGHFNAAYWKNDQLFPLVTLNNSYAEGIAVDGNDVYIVGRFEGPPGTQSDSAVCWKNSVQINLSPNSKGWANSVKIVGSVLYVTGATELGNSHTATVWKNYIAYPFNEPYNLDAFAYSGTDSFFVGGSNGDAAYWKNNILHEIQPKSSFAYSVAIKENDLYFGGSERSTGDAQHAAYWKNDEMVKLYDSTYSQSYVHAIAFAGTDFYAVGGVYDASQSLYLQVYWKNGTFQRIGNAGVIWAITCVPR